jgi:hypothetical protein
MVPAFRMTMMLAPEAPLRWNSPQLVASFISVLFARLAQAAARQSEFLQSRLKSLHEIRERRLNRFQGLNLRSGLIRPARQCGCWACLRARVLIY